MKKLSNALLFSILALVFICPRLVSASINTNEYLPEDIDGNSYIIGTYLFSEDTALTIRPIMVASRTITSDNPEDMIIYYKDIDGNWIDSLTGDSLDDLDVPFSITHEDLISVISINADNLVTSANTVLANYVTAGGLDTDAIYIALEDAISDLEDAIANKTGIETAYTTLEGAISDVEDAIISIEAANFLNNYEVSTLVTTTLTLANYEDLEKDINDAIAAFEDLSAGAKAIVEADMIVLQNMANEITEVLAPAKTFFDVNGFVLTFTTTDVTIGDKADVIAAQTAYEALSAEVKAVVDADTPGIETLLEDLLEEIADQEEALILTEVNTYLTDFDVVNLLDTPPTVANATTMLSEATAALVAFGDLSDAAKTRLDGTDTSLQALIDELADYVSAATFLNTHEDALALTTGDVEIADKAAIIAAQDAYEGLTSTVKALVDAQTSGIEALLEDLLEEIADQEVAAIQAEVDSFVTDNATVLALTTGDVTFANAQSIIDVVDAYGDLSQEVKDLLEIDHPGTFALLTELEGAVNTLMAALETEVTEFLGLYNTLLNTTVEQVSLDDMATLEAASLAFNGASADLKTTISIAFGSDVATILSALNTKVTSIITTTVTEFQTTYATLLGVTADATAYMTLSDNDLFDDLDAAVLEISTMHAIIQDALETEIDAINELNTLVEPLRTEASGFTTTYGDLLEMDIKNMIKQQTITFEQMLTIKGRCVDALVAYDGMSEGAKYIAGENAEDKLRSMISNIQGSEISTFIYDINPEVYNLLMDYVEFIDIGEGPTPTLLEIQDMVDKIEVLASEISSIKANITEEFTDLEYDVVLDSYVYILEDMLLFSQTIESGTVKALEFIADNGGLLDDLDAATEAMLLAAIESIEDLLDYTGVGPTGTLLMGDSNPTRDAWMAENIWRIAGFGVQVYDSKGVDIYDIYAAYSDIINP